MSSNWNKDNNNFNEGATYGSQSQGKRNIGNKMSDNIQNLGQQGKESLNQGGLGGGSSGGLWDNSNSSKNNDSYNSNKDWSSSNRSGLRSGHQKTGSRNSNINEDSYDFFPEE